MSIAAIPGHMYKGRRREIRDVCLCFVGEKTKWRKLFNTWQPEAALLL